MPAPPRAFRFNEGGTRFRIYPQPARLGFAPLTVHIDARPGSILTGPRAALLDTRDEMAHLLARAWRSMPLQSLTFAVAVTHLLAADAEMAGDAQGPRAALIRELFEARGIATPR